MVGAVELLGTGLAMRFGLIDLPQHLEALDALAAIVAAVLFDRDGGAAHHEPAGAPADQAVEPGAIGTVAPNGRNAIQRASLTPNRRRVPRRGYVG